MIPILCFSCQTHLCNTSVDRLDWPLYGEMFSVVYGGWFLRPGMLNLDVFCPVCGAFPFHYDPFIPGANAVGKSLTVTGEDGKPIIRTIKQILLSSREPAPLSQGEPRGEFPCLVCGAKKRFHKKGCSLKTEPTLPPSGSEPTDIPTVNDRHARQSDLKDNQRSQDPFIASIAARVQGMSADKGDGPPTEAEVREVLADREARRLNGDNQEDIRPGEGYQSNTR